MKRMKRRRKMSLSMSNGVSEEGRQKDSILMDPVIYYTLRHLVPENCFSLLFMISLLTVFVEERYLYLLALTICLQIWMNLTREGKKDLLGA